MPELPEIVVLSKQMRREVVGKTIAEVKVFQPKNLNISVEDFLDKIVGRRIFSVKDRGKWLFVALSGDLSLLINLGMGGDLLRFKSSNVLPKKYKFKMEFTDGSGFTIDFFWFGYIHLVAQESLQKHKMTGELGLSPLDDDFTLEYWKGLLSGRRGRVKFFLINQRRVAGIGNVYVQDILFKARLHPHRNINTLTDKKVEQLYASMREVLTKSVEKGGLAYERDFYGNKGGFSEEDFLVAYKTGKPCPLCSTLIKKIRTGSTASYICPKCQK